MSSPLSTNFEVGLYHITADKKLYHSDGNIAEAFGNVVISARAQRLSADYVWFNRLTYDIKARGNVTYVTGDTVMEATEMHLNLQTKLGNIFYGRVMTDQYLLKGQLIRKVSDNRFITTDGEYSTCRDCPESWRVAAKKVDMTVEGYAFMSNVHIIVKDVPTLYLPYLVLPVKRKRQTGLLVPDFGYSNDKGYGFLQPLFVVIDNYQDATFSWGRYGRRGTRLNTEYRYKSYNNVEGMVQTYFQEDKLFRENDNMETIRSAKRSWGFLPKSPVTHRGSILTKNDWPLFKRAKFKFLFQEISDRNFVQDWAKVYQGVNEISLNSQFLQQSNFDEFFISSELKRYRSLVTADFYGFDKSMVQATPTVYFGAKERKILGPIYGNIFASFDNYLRPGGFGAYSDLNRNGSFDLESSERLRETQRLILVPELSLPFRLGRFLGLTPSLQYNELGYLFNIQNANGTYIGGTSRRYMIARIEGTTIFERVFNYDGVRVEKLKHQISPTIAFNNVPWYWENPKHPFTEQLKKTDGGFDRFDYIPLTNSDLSNSENFERFPVGKSIEFGFYSRLIRKARKVPKVPKFFPYDMYVPAAKVYPEPRSRMHEHMVEREKRWDEHDPRYGSYGQIWDLSAKQAYDFKEAGKPNYLDKKPYSFLEVASRLSIDNFSNSIDYKYLPYTKIPYDSKVNGINNPDGTPIEDINLLSDYHKGTLGLPIYQRQHQVSYSINWTFKELVHPRGILFIRRSIGIEQSLIGLPNRAKTLGFHLFWSVNENLALDYHESRDLLKRQISSRRVGTMYTPGAECWRLILGWAYSDVPTLGKGKSNSEFSFNLGFNLWGGGSFVGINELEQSAGGFMAPSS